MARRWAQLGFDVLRLDRRGIGGSTVAPSACETSRPYLRELAAASL
jgi:alpha-beta hydrolase superfamily lysophospholipase